MKRRLMVFVVISLVAGIVVGYGSGYAIYQSQILRLESEVSNLQLEVLTLTADYANLNITYNDLQANYNTLNMTYNELEGNYSLLTETIDVRLIDVCTPAWLIRIESGSMQPTLKIGDVVVVRKVMTYLWNLTVGYTNGTIVAFWGDSIGKPGEIIVHRLVNIVYWIGYYCILETHGDNNPYGAVEHFSEEYLIGEVIAIISEPS